MNILCFDLELNQLDGNPKIIQIGAVVGDSFSGKVLDRLSIFINPNELLTDYIINLTGITQEQVDKGMSVYDGYLTLKEMHQKYKCSMNPMTWGIGDCEALKKELPIGAEWCFGYRYFDIKTLHQIDQIANRRGIKGGLEKALNRKGINFPGEAHNALADAEATWLIGKYYLDILKDDV